MSSHRIVLNSLGATQCAHTEELSPAKHAEKRLPESELFDLSSLGLLGCSLISILTGSHRAIYVEKILRNGEGRGSENASAREANLLTESQVHISTRTALMYPVIASVILLLMFYLFSAVTFILFFFTLFGAFVGISFSLYPLTEKILPSLTRTASSIPWIGQVNNALLLACGISVFIIGGWLVTGHWILSNSSYFSLRSSVYKLIAILICKVIGFGYCVLALSLIRAPNMKIIAILLVLLFFYDIFWVFFSERIFGENVLVTVATKPTVNPLNTAATALGAPGIFSPNLELPMKFVVGSRILGLGDIVMPGLLLVYLFKTDYFRRTSPWNGKGYYIYSLVGYIIGLLIAMVAAFVYYIPQPALLYLVPSTMLPAIIIGYNRRDLYNIWNGTPLAMPEPPQSEQPEV